MAGLALCESARIGVFLLSANHKPRSLSFCALIGPGGTTFEKIAAVDASVRHLRSMQSLRVS